MKYSPKTAALEQMDKVHTITLEALVGILHTYEMNYLNKDAPRNIALRIESKSVDDKEDEVSFLSKNIARMLQERRARQFKNKKPQNGSPSQKLTADKQPVRNLKYGEKFKSDRKF